MNLLLLKALAVALTLSQILTQPDVKTSFSPETDRAEVRKILRQGCDHMKGVLAKINPKMAKLDPGRFLEMQIAAAKANNQSTDLLPGLSMADAKLAHDLFCTDTEVTATDKILTEVIGYYNLSMYDLPDVNRISPENLHGYSTVIDGRGQKLTDLYRSSRRKVLPFEQIPQRLKDAFLAAEDKDFYTHKGVDETGVMFAGLRNFMKRGSNADEGSPAKGDQGGSTITQQLIKNLLLTSEVTYERKMREMVLAYRLEKILSKDQILALYMNYVLLGRSSWGVGMAAESYFGKTVDQLSIAEAAFLAGMPKGPAFYNPDKYPERSHQRTAIVLERMLKNGKITKEEHDQALNESKNQQRVSHKPPHLNSAGHFLDEVAAQIKKQVGIDPRESVLQIQSTLIPEIQLAAEKAVQKGLVDFETKNGRAQFAGAEANLTETIEKLKAAGAGDDAWLTALKTYSPKMSDASWPTALVVSTGKGKYKVGMRDGEIYSLKGGPKGSFAKLKVNDIVYVEPSFTKKNPGVELKFAPQVQGAAVVLENKTGRVLAMVGGFSHDLSRFNRAADMVRQPGSLAKPLTYLAALNFKLQPNTLIWDSAITLAPVSGKGRSWSPNNYESSGGTGSVTMRKGLEDSRNRVTARLASGMWHQEPALGLDWILSLMKECGMNENPARYWPVILGSQETSMLRVAGCYAALANGGTYNTPRVITQVNRDGRTLIDETALKPVPMAHTDQVSVFQLRNMLQGVIESGTAASLKSSLKDIVPKGSLSEYLAGKTGTSQGSNDTWFAGFTQDLTIVVWVGYDNGPNEKRRNLGSGTGGSVAAPIFANILRGTVKDYPLRPFEGPTGEVASQVVPQAIAADGQMYFPDEGANMGATTIDWIRMDEAGNMRNTREALLGIEPPAFDEPVYEDPIYREGFDNDRGYGVDEWGNLREQDPYAEAQARRQQAEQERIRRYRERELLEEQQYYERQRRLRRQPETDIWGQQTQRQENFFDELDQEYQ